MADERAEAQQGGNFEYFLGLQPDDDTLIDDVRKMRKGKRPAVRFAMNPAGDRRRSESISNSIFPSKSQSGRTGGNASIETEFFARGGMLELIQGLLGGDPHTKSTDVTETTVYDGQITPADDIEVDGVNKTVVKTITDGTAAAGEILVTEPETPGRLEITIAGATGKVKVIGRRKTGLGPRDQVPITEEIDLDDDTNSAITDTSFYGGFRLEIDNTGLTAGTAVEVDIISKPTLRKTVFRERREIPAGYSIQSKHGTEPRTGFAMVPRSGNINISETVRLALELLGRAVWRRRTIEGGVFVEKLSDDSALADADRIDSTFMTDIGAFLTIDGDLTLFDSGDINIDMGLDYQTGKNGSPEQAGVERGDAGANITGTFVVNFESSENAKAKFIKWDERFRDGILSTFVIYIYFWDNTGKEYYHKISLFNVELTEVPSTDVESRGTIKESLSIEAVTEGNDPVIEWEVVDDDGWFGVTPVMTFDEELATASGGGNVKIDFGRAVTDLKADDFEVEGATKGAVTDNGNGVHSLALTASEAGTLKVTLRKNAVEEGNDETTETLLVA